MRWAPGPARRVPGRSRPGRRGERDLSGATVNALSALTQISVALLDCSLADVPDLPARPVAELADLARLANVHTDESEYAATAGARCCPHRAARAPRHQSRRRPTTSCAGRCMLRRRRIRPPDGPARAGRACRATCYGRRSRNRLTAGLAVVEGAADPTAADPRARRRVWELDTACATASAWRPSANPESWCTSCAPAQSLSLRTSRGAEAWD